MSRSVTTEILPERLVEHRAFRAWSRLSSRPLEPTGLEVLKLKTKSAVYRIAGLGEDGTAIVAKRCKRGTGVIEQIVHQEFLSRLPLPAPRFYGFLEDADDPGFCWLFLEDAQGPVYSQSDPVHRELAGRWLAAVHAAPVNESLRRRLPQRGSDHYLELLRSARETLLERRANPVLHVSDLTTLEVVALQCDVIELHWDEVEECCRALPPVLVHGDLVVKNVYLRPAPSGLALLVFDWENAGWGVPATDLCQFRGRTVSPDLAAYGAAMQASGCPLDSFDVSQLARYGSLLRLIDGIHWSAEKMVFGSYLFLETPVSTLRVYETALADLLRTFEWL
jgi:hypothetical protein